MLTDMLQNTHTTNSKKHKRQYPLNILFIFFTIAGLGIISLLIFAYVLTNIPNAENTQMVMLFLTAFICWSGMHFTNHSIHDMRDAEHQDANLEAILDNIADGVLIRDQAGYFLSANPALLKMIPEMELREMSTCAFEKTMRWKRKFFTITTIYIPEAGSVVIFRDQTRCRETEQARDALLATVSHEFRTPLTAVMNYLEMLLMLAKMKKVDGDAFIAHLTRALENSRRLQHLVVNTIEQAQLQAGALEFKPQPFNLSELIQKSSRHLDTSCKQNNLLCMLSIAPNVPTEIKGDSKRLDQALAHLLENAIKFTRQGSVTVNVFMASDNKLAIQVADTGAGIPEEQLPDIFEAFRRASNYAQREYQGVGLGLSIAKQIITSMGGDITASSTLDVGSTFTILLPVEIVR
jgi:signal transduction histidine kinase